MAEGAAGSERSWPPVDVVLLGWRSGDKTCAALRNLVRSGYPMARVFVVDNGSDEGSDATVWAALRAFCPAAVRVDVVEDDPTEAIVDAVASGRVTRDTGAVFVRSARNRGYSGGMNLGLELAARLGGGDYFWLLNNDVLVEQGAIEALVERCEEDPTVGLCGATQHVRDADGRVVSSVPGGFRYWPAFGFESRLDAGRGTQADRDRVEARMFAVHGAAVFGTAQFLGRVGLLGRDRFIYFEEQDWAIRAKRAGFRIAWAPTAHLSNVHTVTMADVDQEAQGRVAVVRYLMARARLLVTCRYYPWAVPTVLLFQAGQAISDLLQRQPRGAWHALLGVLDAFRGRHRSFPQLGTALLPGVSGQGARRLARSAVRDEPSR